MDIGKKIYIADRKRWRAWLKKNHASAKEIWLIYYKKGSGKARIPYDEAVEEALCFGWIDSTVKSIDERRYAQRFSPRKKTSVLSEPNRQRLNKLVAGGKMTKAGLDAVAHAFKPDKKKFAVPKDTLREIKKNKAAWDNFQKLPEDYKRVRLTYIEGRKRHSREMYERSLKHFIKKTAANKRFGFVNIR